MSNQQSAVTRFGGVTPIISVGDVSASLEYYTRILGFNNDWGSGDGFASVSRDRCHLFLSQGNQGHPANWIFIGVGDIDVPFEEYKAKGARIRHPPTNYEWAARCRSKTRTETYSGLARIRKRMNRLVSGSTCAGVAGSNRPKVDGCK